MIAPIRRRASSGPVIAWYGPPAVAAQGTSTSKRRSAQQLEARHVGAAVARGQHRPHPLAVAQGDGVAGEQHPVCAGVPQQRGGAGRVTRRGDDLQVAVEHVTPGERGAHGHRLLDRLAVGFVHEQRCRRPRRREHRLVAVVEVVAREAAERLDRGPVAREPRHGVDERVALRAAQHERPDLGARRERQRFRRRRVQPGHRDVTSQVRHGTVVVEPQERDHVAHVVLAVDPARRRPRTVREDRVRDDAPLGAQGRPDVLGEAEVGGVVAVQVAELLAPGAERELAPAARAGLDAGPRRDLLGDAAAGTLRRLVDAHASNATSSSKLEVKCPSCSPSERSPAAAGWPRRRCGSTSSGA